MTAGKRVEGKNDSRTRNGERMGVRRRKRWMAPAVVGLSLVMVFGSFLVAITTEVKADEPINPSVSQSSVGTHPPMNAVSRGGLPFARQGNENSDGLQYGHEPPNGTHAPKISPPPKNVTLGSVPTSGVAPAASSIHWWFTNLVASDFSEDAQAMFYNITTPDSYGQSNTIFIGASTWDTYLYGIDTGDYDQMGIVAGSWYVTQTSNPCATSGGWCAYFSVCLGGAFDSYCSSGTTYFETWEWALQPSTSYEEEFSITDKTDNGGWSVDYSGYLFSSSHQLMDSWSFLTQSAAEDFLHISTNMCYGSSCYLDFTDYEEVYNTGNTVDPWPAFNLHTAIGIYSVQHGSTPHVPWGDYEWTGSGYPTNQHGSFTDNYYSGRQNYVNISNMPFAAWVGSPFGSGLYSVTVGLSKGSSFSVDAGIDPLADPAGGYLVYYYPEYCSLPCSDYNYHPADSSVQPDSDIDSPNAVMQISGTVPGPGTYLMSLYAYCPVCDSTYLSYWTLTFTY